MRLVPLLLTGLSLVAQSPAQRMPWDGAVSPPWATAVPGPAVPGMPPRQGKLPLQDVQVRCHTDGTLHVVDRKGVIIFRMGLPGRISRMWRDEGVPMDGAGGPFLFPTQTPLSKGLGNLQMNAGDFRPALEGLLWVLDDGERFLTVVHPALAQAIYLPLPVGQNFEIFLYPDRLELRERSESTRPGACWSLSWMVLLPHLLRLSERTGQPQPGSALVPYPPE